MEFATLESNCCSIGIFCVSGEKSNQFCHKEQIGLSLSQNVTYVLAYEVFASYQMIILEDNSKNHCICCMQ